MKKLIFAALIVSAFIFISAAAFTNNVRPEDDPEIPDEIELCSDYGNVDFPHKAHHDLELSCMECHHTLKSADEVPAQTCHECHTAESEISTQKAFHDTCRTCHRQTKKENRESPAPTSCRQCHTKG